LSHVTTRVLAQGRAGGDLPQYFIRSVNRSIRTQEGLLFLAKLCIPLGGSSFGQINQIKYPNSRRESNMIPKIPNIPPYFSLPDLFFPGGNPIMKWALIWFGARGGGGWALNWGSGWFTPVSAQWELRPANRWLAEPLPCLQSPLRSHLPHRQAFALQRVTVWRFL